MAGIKFGQYCYKVFWLERPGKFILPFLWQSARYAIVKESILKAYELVPEPYRKKFRSAAKDSKQKFVESAQEKEWLFDRWCVLQNVDGNFAKLR